MKYINLNLSPKICKTETLGAHWVDRTHIFISLDGQNMELINPNGQILTIKGPMMAGKGIRIFFV